MALAFAGALLCHGAKAEELPDPTRPPPGILAMPAAAGAYQPSGLQSVIISGRRRVAIIDGETVELGGKFGDARLIAVNEGDVVLQGKRGREVLSLFPAVKISGKKTPAKLQSPAGTARPEPWQSQSAAHGEKK